MATTSQTVPTACDGARIRDRREALDLSQVQLAQAVGMNQGYLSMIERGLRRPSADMLALIAKALNCHPDDLLVGADERAWVDNMHGDGPESPEGDY